MENEVFFFKGKEVVGNNDRNLFILHSFYRYFLSTRYVSALRSLLSEPKVYWGKEILMNELHKHKITILTSNANEQKWYKEKD